MARIDIVDAKFSPEGGPFIVDVSDRRARIIAVLDGSGSWGSGAAASGAVARCLSTAWEVRFPTAADFIVETLNECLVQIPAELRAESFGHEFSFVAALITEAETTIVACGWYGALHFEGESRRVLYRPLAWVEQQIEEGNLTPQEAEAHKFRNVFAGKMVSADQDLVCEVETVPNVGTIVLCTMELFRRLLNAPVDMVGEMSAQELHALETDIHAKSRPLVLIKNAV